MHSRRYFLKAGMFAMGAINTWPSMAVALHTGTKAIKSDELPRLQAALKSQEPMVWLFTGDSITQGAKHTHGWRSYPEVAAERLRWELGRTRDVVINTAISGNTTADLLADLEWRINRLHPNVVSLMLGTNDCAVSKNLSLAAFEMHLGHLVDHVRSIGAIPLMHVPAPILIAKAEERSRIPDYAEVVREVAARKGVVVIDHWRHWQEVMRQKGERYVFNNWLNDPLHPNGKGHLELARLFFKTIGIYDEAAPTCGAPYYEGEH